MEHNLQVHYTRLTAANRDALPEMIRRVRAALVADQPSPDRVIEAGEVRIDKDAHKVTVAGVPIVLTGLEFRLLVTLAERDDRVQTRTMLLNDVWELNAGVNTRTVDTHVKRLRDKLGSAGRFIETVRNVGYRFSAPREEGALAKRDADRVRREGKRSIESSGSQSGILSTRRAGTRPTRPGCSASRCPPSMRSSRSIICKPLLDPVWQNVG